MPFCNLADWPSRPLCASRPSHPTPAPRARPLCCSSSSTSSASSRSTGDGKLKSAPLSAGNQRRRFDELVGAVEAENDRFGVGDVEAERFVGRHAEGAAEDAADGVKVRDENQIAGRGGGQLLHGGPGAVANDR